VRSRSFNLRHKFKAKPVLDDGHRYDSKLEWQFKNHLELLKKSGEVLFFLRQVPFHLPGGLVYKLDFMPFYSDGTVRLFDPKGVETPEFKMKKKMVEEIYPVEIEIVKQNDF
jgi:hypothetical protein